MYRRLFGHRAFSLRRGRGVLAITLLEILNVSKAFDGATAAVRDVSLTLDRGEILSLLGPSGCGKTTLLRMVAGLERPDRGTIRFDGADLSGIPPHARDFGMMFQDFALFPHRNVRDNVAFGLRMHRLPAADIARRTAEMLALVDLDGLETREIGQLSGGEQQRVALARALAPGPRLLLLDEPLGALDRALRERLMLDVRAILKRVGMTAIYVTHDQTEAFAVGDRLAVMNAGVIEQIGPPQAVHERPATPFVAQFLGFHNLLPGRVTASGEIETPVGRFQATFPVHPHAAVTVLIKPIMGDVVKPKSAAPLVNEIEAIVDAVTFRGRFSQIWLTSGPHRLLFEEAGDPVFRPGETVRLNINPDQIMVYEAAQQDGPDSRK